MIRTDMHCHQCGKSFIAEFEEKINGNHIAECPYCYHEHCRVFKKGQITDDRWDHREQRVDVEKRCVWKAEGHPMPTSKSSLYIRNKWLERLKG